jgi:hypothetical protein
MRSLAVARVRLDNRRRWRGSLSLPPDLSAASSGVGKIMTPEDQSTFPSPLSARIGVLLGRRLVDGNARRRRASLGVMSVLQVRSVFGFV